MIARRPQGPRGPQGPRAAHRLRRRDRRLDGERHLHPHRHDAEDLRRSVRGLLRRDRRRHRGQGDRREVDERLRDGPGVAARRRPQAARRRGGRRHRLPAGSTPPTSSGPTARRSPRRASATSIDPANARLSPLRLKTGAWPSGPRQIVDRRRHRREASTTRSATRCASRRRAGRRAYRLDRHGLVRRGRLDRLRQHRGLGRRDRAGAARAQGPLRLDLDRREGRHVAGGARPRREAARPGHARGQGQREKAAEDSARGGQGDVLHPLLPARLRRHRAVRRRVRDLQHAVDHRRPAHTRVRDAADARRLAQAGAALGPARRPRDRADRVRRSGCSSGSASRRACS